MGIYATQLWMNGSEHGEDAPYLYQGSHILPTEDSPRGGALEVGTIPNYIDRRPNGAGPGLHDWIRIGVASDDAAEMQTVVLNRPHVEHLRDTLTEWLQRSAEPSE